MIEDAVEIKLLTIGDSGVGKSWLLLRWSNENAKFLKNQAMPTVGIDYKMKNVELDGKRAKIQIWDTAGQERFKTITASYYRNAQGILLVYDVTSRSSFNNIRLWMAQIQQHADPNEISKILVGNKCDLLQQRVVNFDEGEALAREYHMPFIETSALNNINVDEAFMKLAKDVKTRLAEEANKPVGKKGKKPSPPNSKVTSTIDVKDTKKKRSWCIIL